MSERAPGCLGALLTPSRSGDSRRDHASRVTAVGPAGPSTAAPGTARHGVGSVASRGPHSSRVTHHVLVHSRSLLAILTLLALSACREAAERVFTPPRAEFRGVAVRGIGPAGGVLEVRLLVHNTNPYPLSAAG